MCLCFKTYDCISQLGSSHNGAMMHFIKLFSAVSLLSSSCVGVYLNVSHICMTKGKDGLHSVAQCCPDFKWNGETCTECPAGTYGDRCKEKCLPGYFGVQCKEICNCSTYDVCDPVQGCICMKGWTGVNCTENEKWDESKHSGNDTQICNCSECLCGLLSEGHDIRNIDNEKTLEFATSVMVYIVVMAVLLGVVWFVASVEFTRKKRQSSRFNKKNSKHVMKSIGVNMLGLEFNQMVADEGIYDEI